MHFKKVFFIVTFQLINLIICCSYAQSPPEVWISPKFNLNTPRWDTIRFNSIQNGINAVAETGTVHVDTGVYHENIIIKKHLYLLGEGPDVTEISAEGSNNAVYVEGVSGGSIIGISFTNATEKGITLGTCDSMLIQNNICKNNGFYGISLSTCENIIVENNTILENVNWGIELDRSKNNIIKNNYVNIEKAFALLMNSASENLIENNEFYSEMDGNIHLTNSYNNRFINNKIYGRISCKLIRSDFSPNNLYENNDLSGEDNIIGIYLTYSSNTIVSNNNLSGFNTFGIIMYHTDSSIINGNKIHDPGHGNHPYEELLGSILVTGESSHNLIIGNEISDAPKGISVHHHSDYNQIINNLIQGSTTGIIINNSNNNTIYKNNFIENISQGFDNGINSWVFNGTGNYWSNYTDTYQYSMCNNDTLYKIPPNGMDSNPSASSFSIEPIITPELITMPICEMYKDELYISDEVSWNNQNVELTHLIVLDGGSLIVDSSIITFINQFSGYGGIKVWPGGSLKINNSEIFFNGLPTNAEEGATLEIRKSKLYNVGYGPEGSGLRCQTNNVIFTDNLIEDGGEISFYSNAEIENNNFINTFNGITIYGDNLTISNNKVQNSVFHGILIRGSNNTIYNNTIKNCWGKSIRVFGEANDIYKNNFISYDTSTFINLCIVNNWSENEQGNYYSDYLDRYPAAKVSASNADQWDLPYENECNIDAYPARVCFYNDTVIDVPDQPVLVSPNSNSIISTVDAIFKWSNSENAKSYRIQISEDSTFLLPIVNQGNIYNTAFCYLLENNKKYYWRIISLNDGGYSNWSEIWQFEIKSDTITSMQPIRNTTKEITLYQNFPNPFYHSTNITFELPWECDVVLKISDFLGKEVTTIVSRKLQKGNHIFKWYAQDYDGGIYFLTLITDNYTETRKLVLLK